MKISKRGFAIDKFKEFINKSGANILQPTNSFEALRFSCEEGVGVVYESNKSHISLTGSAITAYSFFIKKRQWIASKNYQAFEKPEVREQLLERDGENCFYCKKHMQEDEITIEHILSVLHGGNDNIANLALTHKSCNLLAGSLPIVEKINLIARG